MRRPKANTIDRTPVIDKIALKVYEWFDKGEDLESLKGDMKQMLEKCDSSSDGYELAEYLERKLGYSSDSQLVSILDDVPFLINEQVSIEVAEWVKHLDIKAKYSIDDHVKIHHERKIVDGIIIAVYDNSGEYSVYVESCGHVKEGIGTYGFIVKFEDIID
jgi:hypothetical protein